MHERSATVRAGGRLRLTRAIAAAVTVGATLLPVTAAHAAAAKSPAARAAVAFVADINAARTARGLPAVKVSPDLTKVAVKWSSTMAGQGTLSHNPALATQIHHWSGLAENVGMGQTVPQLHAAFMHSAPHRANILDPDYTQVGVGVTMLDGLVYVVEDFRRPA